MTEIIHDVSPPDFRVVTERERYLIDVQGGLMRLIEHTQRRVEQLEADNERLRAVIEGLVQHAEDARRALEPKPCP